MRRAAPTRAERLVDAPLDVLGRQPEVQRPEADVLEDGRHEELVVGVLKDHADRAPDVGQRALGHRRAADVDRALRRREQPVQVHQQRRLAGAVGADDGDRLAVADRERDAVESARAVGVGEAEPADGDRVVAHRPAPRDEPARAAGVTSTRRKSDEERRPADARRAMSRSAQAQPARDAHLAVEAAALHRQVDALGAGEGAQQQLPEHLRVDAQARAAAPDGAQRARPRHAQRLVAEHEDVAVEQQELRDEHVGHAQPLERQARRR